MQLNEERVYQYICKSFSVKDLSAMELGENATGVTATDVETSLGINRNNASSLLNKLVREKKLIKIDTRPVYFIPRQVLADFVNGDDLEDVYTSDEIARRIRRKLKAADPFKSLIGYKSSLSEQIEKAKAAILYPPNGLHTLIIGESGSGKSLFAQKMHQFGMQERNMEPDQFPYVEFNCADYSNNPQLLISQLFGHAKGAYTGATEEKTGLVEKADNGILFLDEVHRLPPEGQEMLFFLIDTKKYHRLGETVNNRSANVLIIAATTENPQRALLKTFMRRIPVLLQLPSLKDKSIAERIELIEHLFMKEAVLINREITISSEVVLNLAKKDYSGNIGQLSSDVKMLCAQSFLESQGTQGPMVLNSQFLKRIKNFNQGQIALTENDIILLKKYSSDIVLKPTSQIDYKANNSEDDQIYSNLSLHIKAYSESGLGKDKIRDLLSNEIDIYYKRKLSKFAKRNIQVNDLFKFIEKEVVDFAIDMMSLAARELGIEYSKKSIFGFAFHMKYLLEQIGQRKQLTNVERDYIRNEYSLEYGVAEMIAARTESRFKCAIDEDEKYFLTILLANSRCDEEGPVCSANILVIAHGESTATSMAGVCNSLLGTNAVFAIDMPLERSIEDTYSEVLKLIQETENQNGWIFLVDMGSLAEFGTIIEKETGIPTRTIENVSTLMLIEVARNSLFKNLTLNEVYTNSIGVLKDLSREPVAKPPAIISVCVTGEGVGSAFKNMIENELKKAGMEEIKVFEMSFMDIKCNTQKLKSILEQYEPIASIGNFDPKLSVPYFHIEKMLSKIGLAEIFNVIEKSLSINSSNAGKPGNDPFLESEQLLSRYLTYLNPRLAVDCGREFIQEMNTEEISNSRELMVSLPIHIAFMLERNIMGDISVFDNEKEYISTNREIYEKIKKCMHVVEDRFPKVPISDADICYVILAINGK